MAAFVAAPLLVRRPAGGGRACGAQRAQARRRPRACAPAPAAPAPDAGGGGGTPRPRLVVWGPPGSGKTSLCEALSHSHGVVHVSTGDLLRAHVRYGTGVGRAAEGYLGACEAVPDEIVVPLVLGRLAMADCVERGFVLDGFPRSIAQHERLVEAGFAYACALMLHAPRTVLERRIEGRRVDPDTGLLYNVICRRPEEQEVLERLVPLTKDDGRNVSQHLALYGRIAADMFDPITSGAVRVDAGRDVDAVLAEVTGVLRELGIMAKARAVGKQGSSAAAASAAATAVASLLDGGAEPDVSAASIAGASAATGKRGRSAKKAEPVAGEGRAVGGEVEDVRDDGEGEGDGVGKGERAAEGVQGKADGVAGAAPEMVVTKSPITLIRCDGYMCERESVDGSNIAFRGAATEQVMLVWNKRPSTVLLLAKKDPELMPSVIEAAQYLINEQKLRVIVEPQVQTEALANGLYLDAFTQPELLHNEVDFVVCLGGDGLILHVSTLFRTAVPPVLSFNLGSLGFLTPFDYDNFRGEISELLNGSCLLSLRMRLTCSILHDGTPVKEFEVLNEVVVDRGASPYLSNLDCFCDDNYITTVQADGIIMSTPTGSTAYSMSAGGSMVHPSVPAILFTPICPHSLSFRPIIFPDAAKLRINIAEDARSHAWASFDGKFRQQLRRGDGLVVQMSLYPVPTVNKTDDTGDWFQSLDRAFNFNSRAIQKGLAETSALPRPPMRKPGIPIPSSPVESVDSEETSAADAKEASAAEAKEASAAEAKEASAAEPKKASTADPASTEKVTSETAASKAGKETPRTTATSGTGASGVGAPVTARAESLAESDDAPADDPRVDRFEEEGIDTHSVR